MSHHATFGELRRNSFAAAAALGIMLGALVVELLR
jgi:hypothetical protein